MIKRLTFTMKVPKGSRAPLSRMLTSRRRYSKHVGIVMRDKGHLTIELKPRAAQMFVRGLKKAYAQ